MNPGTPNTSMEACTARIVRDTVLATGTPMDTPAHIAERTADIVNMFRALEPRDAFQAMLAGQCIALRYALTSAYAELSAAEAGFAMHKSMRTTIVSMTRMMNQLARDIQASQTPSLKHRIAGKVELRRRLEASRRPDTLDARTRCCPARSWSEERECRR